MIAKLTGSIDSLGDGVVVIDVHGVGYLVACSRRTLSGLAARSTVSLLIETQVRDDAITLYGFDQALERDWFRRLILVQGVGARAALAILSALSPAELAGAIAAADKTMITRAPGVGAKLAGRIVAELREFATRARGAGGAPPAGLDTPRAETATPIQEAVSALVNLGFGSAEALDAVGAAAARLGAGATVEVLISDSLARMAPASSLEGRRS